jgi:catechol 2,3-dioxygenase-like lactoylglutathione lyase family enzyme
MFLGLRTVIYPVADLEAATAWFEEVLGSSPYFRQPSYVGFEVAGYELGLLPAPEGNPPGPITYWGVADADAAVARLLGAGARPGDPVTDVGDGIRTGSVVGPDGNVVGVIEHPHFALPDPASLPPNPGPGR